MSEKKGEQRNFILELDEIKRTHPVGNKAFNLSFLSKHGYKVPHTLTCVFEAYDSYKDGDSDVLAHLKEELSKHIHNNQKYSVRSSANIEDATSYSFAGQFSTQLNVEGSENILEAIQTVWKSAEDVNEAEYIKTTNSDSTIKMGVIIQEMVKPIFSGVVFTKNPLTGLDEVIVESVDGYGDALVQEGVTPNRWVYKWGEWKEKPDGKDDRLDIVEELINQSTELAKLYGAPLDLEWCYDGKSIYWLQLRVITALQSAKLYSNRMSREFLPGIIKPLVWSINTPMINGSWKDLFKEVIGDSADSIDIHKLSKQFYYRAYFNMGIIGDIFEVLGMPREALEILAGIESAGTDRPMFRPSSRTFVHLPRVLLTILRKLMFSKSIEVFLLKYRKKYNYYDSMDLQSLNYEDTLKQIESLFDLNQYGSYMVIVSQLLNSLYNMMLKQLFARNDITIEELNLTPKTKRLLDSDPRHSISNLSQIYSSLTDSEKEKLEKDGLKDVSGDTEFEKMMLYFLKHFGHLSDSGNDFSRESWRETPELVLNMIKSESANPSRSKGLEMKELESFINSKRMNRTIFMKAMRYQEYRELVNALYTFGYSQFRRFFLHLGNSFAKDEILNSQDDIFFLTYQEIRNIVRKSLEPATAWERIEIRKKEIDQYSNIVLPEIIIGDSPPLVVENKNIGMELSGVPTSGGHYTGPARIVTGIGDFGKIGDGDVLVIPYSDVSWTPLFTLAKAVVSESGGLLSHCSIVAREYRIPAVVSVNGATQIEDGTILAVDGNNGQVFIFRSKENV